MVATLVLFQTSFLHGLMISMVAFVCLLLGLETDIAGLILDAAPNL